MCKPIFIRIDKYVVMYILIKKRKYKYVESRVEIIIKMSFDLSHNIIVMLWYYDTIKTIFCHWF